MAERFINIKEVLLKNNCPECYNNSGLHLSVKQKIIETRFYKSMTSEIKYELNCQICNSLIYPEQWTDDIDRVVDYQKKAFQLKPASTYLKKIAWIVIIGIAAIIITILFVVFSLNL